MSPYTFTVDGLEIRFDYYSEERACTDIDSSNFGPGCDAEIEVTEIWLWHKGVFGQEMIDLFDVLKGGAWATLKNWAEEEAWNWLREEEEGKRGEGRYEREDDDGWD